MSNFLAVRKYLMNKTSQEYMTMFSHSTFLFYFHFTTRILFCSFSFFIFFFFYWQVLSPLQASSVFFGSPFSCVSRTEQPKRYRRTQYKPYSSLIGCNPARVIDVRRVHSDYYFWICVYCGTLLCIEKLDESYRKNYSLLISKQGNSYFLGIVHNFKHFIEKSTQ